MRRFNAAELFGLWAGGSARLEGNMLNNFYFKSACYLSLSLSATLGQTVSGTQLSTLPRALPVELRSAMAAIGDRFLAPGKERITMNGTLSVGSAAPKTVMVISELPRKFSYLDGSGASVTSNGTATTANVSVDNLVMLQSLFEDTLDGMLYQAPTAVRFRPLMHRARTDDGKAKIYNGPYVDIYELVLAEPSLGMALQQKHFYFDSTTHLLSQVVYLTGTPQSPTRVQTTFTNWQMVNGTQVPGAITRTENGVMRLKFVASQTTVGPVGNTSVFEMH